jgi:sulfoxide reductase heme-binding subunit YedZ
MALVLSKHSVKILLALGSVGPLIWLAYLIILERQQPTSGLGPEPVEGMLHYLGVWSMNALLVAFSVSPLRRVLRQPVLGRSRRMMGLFAFTSVVLHLAAYIVLYAQSSLHLILEDFVERTYITAGLAAFLGLLLMAITSTGRWRRRLGQRWLQLHKAIYAIIPLALLHLFWLRKDGYEDVLIYSVWFFLLLAERRYSRRKTKIVLR